VRCDDFHDERKQLHSESMSQETHIHGMHDDAIHTICMTYYICIPNQCPKRLMFLVCMMQYNIYDMHDVLYMYFESRRLIFMVCIANVFRINVTTDSSSCIPVCLVE